MPGPPSPLCLGTLPCMCTPRQRLALGQVWGCHQGQMSCSSSHIPLSWLNFPLLASALFSAQLERNPLELLFLPLFPNLDGPKAPQGDKGKFIASLCLWHCWNTLLSQILHQGSVGKAQCPQHSLTLTYICPSLLTTASGTLTLCPCHCPLSLGSRVVPQLWQSLCHPLGTTGALGSCSELCWCLGSSRDLGESQVPHGSHGATLASGPSHTPAVPTGSSGAAPKDPEGIS